MKSNFPLACIVAARPNFMKMGPVVKELKNQNIPYKFIHTGQHYDKNMSKVFFDDLKLPQPDINLEIGSGSHAQQTAHVMMGFEKWLQENQCRGVLVAGDVNSTMACAITASKLHLPVIHLEAGLRSQDRQMPEEINRILTDVISDLCLTPSADGNENLLHEGIPDNRICMVGNAMIDSLMAFKDLAETTHAYEKNKLIHGQYALVTLHRPSNVDQPDSLHDILKALNTIGQDIPVLFPIHPRTRKNIETFQLQGLTTHITLVNPLSYLEFLNLEAHAQVVITDSGGIQEETTVLGVPCLTYRENTERPITCTVGTNTLVGTNAKTLLEHYTIIKEGTYKTGSIPPLWDGKTAQRVVSAINEHIA